MGGGVQGGRREVLERTAALEVLHHLPVQLNQVPTLAPHRTAQDSVLTRTAPANFHVLTLCSAEHNSRSGR